MKYKILNVKKVCLFYFSYYAKAEFYILIEKKMQGMSQDEIIQRSRLEIGDDITSHKDYATFFSK